MEQNPANPDHSSRSKGDEPQSVAPVSDSGASSRPDTPAVSAGPAVPQAADVTTGAKPAAFLVVTVLAAIIIAVLAGLVMYAYN